MAYRLILAPSRARLSALCSNHPVTQVARILGCHRATVRSWILQLGITETYWSKYDLPSGKELSSLSEAHSDAVLAKRFGCSEQTVRSRRHADGIFRSRIRRRYRLDETFFEKIDTEQKAYVLGFLSADGTISNHGRSVILMLHAKDEHILRDIRKAMGSNAKIFTREKIPAHPNRGPYKFIYFGSQKLVADLALHGVAQRKSLTLRYPTTVRKAVERHYLRGLLDGDGTIRDNSFAFLATEEMIDRIVDVVETCTGIRLTKTRADKLWTAVGCRGSKRVLHWLYRDATIFLKRKHRRFLSHWQ